MLPRRHRCQGLGSVPGHLQYHSCFFFCSLSPGAQDHFQPDLTEMFQMEFFSHRLRRIQAASAEGCLNSTRHWRLHMKEHTLKHPLSREEALIKPLAHCERLVVGNPLLAPIELLIFTWLIVLNDKRAFLGPRVSAKPPLASPGGVCLGDSSTHQIWPTSLAKGQDNITHEVRIAHFGSGQEGFGEGWLEKREKAEPRPS